MNQQSSKPNDPTRRGIMSRVTGHTGAIAMGALNGGIEYYTRRREHPDESKLISAGVAGSIAAAWYLVPHLMWLKTGADMVTAGAEAIDTLKINARDNLAKRGQANFGGNFQDTDTGATARQRGMQAIMSSRLNARSALSNEARSLHRF
jgi:hypothetical protein